ncbi:MAG TPA: NnrS family protein [Acidiferrobacterales bacterium]
MSAAPHRLMFLAGVFQVLATIAWWSLELIGRAAGTPLLPAAPVPATWAHGFLMVYGVFSFFILGFLMTVYPRWMGGPPITRNHYIPAFVLMSAGVVIFYAGLLSMRPVLLAGIGLWLAGWLTAVTSLLLAFRRGGRHGSHEVLINLALIAAAVGMVSQLFGLLTGRAFFQVLGTDIGLWLYLAPIVFLVSHRMIPFFSQSALVNYDMLRPAWSPVAVTAGLAAHLVLDSAGLDRWLFLVDLPVTLIALHHSHVWGLRRSFEVRLLAMLHIAFLWFGVAMLLYAAHSLALWSGAATALGRAPLHALSLGFVTAMVIAMVSRVTLGHSGQALSADTLTWWVFLGIYAATVLRIAAELLPGVAATLQLASALAWLAAFLPWALRYAPLYLRPRRDGQPG